MIGVTGGRGFIGSAIVQVAKSRGFGIVQLDVRNGVNICSDNLDSLAQCKTVIHCAGMLGTGELFDVADEAVHTNVVCAHQIIKYCAENGIHLITIHMPTGFPSIYAATKECARRLISAYHNAKGLRTSTVRAYHAYGPGQAVGKGHPQKIIPTFASRAWQGLPLPVWGDGTQGVDLIHADDIAHMVMDAINYTNDETFDAGTGICTSVLDVANAINDYTGNKAGIEFLPMRPGEVADQVYAKEKLGWQHLDWHPKMDWSKLMDTVDAYKGRYIWDK